MTKIYTRYGRFIMILGILKEKDKRVAIVPDVLPKLQELGLDIVMVRGAGVDAGYPDAFYKDHNVDIMDQKSVLTKADIIATFNPIPIALQAQAKPTAVLVSRYAPYDNKDITSKSLHKSQTIFSLDMIPRITIAQASDVLSSLASIAGYKAVLLAAQHFGRYIPMLSTAAGSIPPAKVLVLGAGVAGLQAIATAKRLGAVVMASDTRSAARDEVMSLGAKFVEVEGAREDASAGGYAVEQSDEFKQRQRQAVHETAIKSDIIIATAQVRGIEAPKLIDKETVDQMKPGSVIIDLAASTGGNVAVTENERTVNYKGITVIGDSDLSRLVPNHASLLFAKNIANFLKFMLVKTSDDKTKLSPTELSQEIVEKSCIALKGKALYSSSPRSGPGSDPRQKSKNSTTKSKPTQKTKSTTTKSTGAKSTSKSTTEKKGSVVKKPVAKTTPVKKTTVKKTTVKKNSASTKKSGGKK